jgi:hypothetical protein
VWQGERAIQSLAGELPQSFGRLFAMPDHHNGLSGFLGTVGARWDNAFRTGESNGRKCGRNVSSVH